MTELEALRRVAEAAQILAHSCGVIRGKTPEDDDTYTVELDHIRELNATIAALDALPTEAPGEMVPVRGAVMQHHDDLFFVAEGQEGAYDGIVLSTVVAYVRKRDVAEIVATVEAQNG